jgi:hypothetical protein
MILCWDFIFQTGFLKHDGFCKRHFLVWIINVFVFVSVWCHVGGISLCLLFGLGPSSKGFWSDLYLSANRIPALLDPPPWTPIWSAPKLACAMSRKTCACFAHSTKGRRAWLNTTIIWTSTFGWYVVRCGSENWHQKHTYWEEIGLCAQTMLTIMGSIVNVIGERGGGACMTP